MWTMENLHNVFYYQKHSLLDFTQQTKSDIPFTLGLQMEWQLETMMNFEHQSTLSIDTTFATNLIGARHTSMSFTMLCSVFNVLHLLTSLTHVSAYESFNYDIYSSTDLHSTIYTQDTFCHFIPFSA